MQFIHSLNKLFGKFSAIIYLIELLLKINAIFCKEQISDNYKNRIV